MADHFKFIKHSLYENSKIIVWAHNYHIQEAPEQANYAKTLGYWLNQEYPDELYTIWSLAYRGRINYGNVVEIEITKPESIEAILYNARKEFYSLERLRGTGNVLASPVGTRKRIYFNSNFFTVYYQKE